MGDRESLCSRCGSRDVAVVCSTANQSAAYQRLEKMEELLGDLIRFIARTNVKTANGETQLAELELILARLEFQYKSLQEKNESILLRLAYLESRQDDKTGRKQSFVMEGGKRVPQITPALLQPSP
ncbi:hypothetical protein ELQ35_03745 [Peribacillus cavernae]|uniref:Uncharacterized protein n=1 Tax=Peribacillus cavernae TaxID=1674310 RepID=A0A433HT11_9BACI|nr:hypothetical protein [Peribacillus cavernae]MDQ0218475.1 septal ring factor EnvC (AmiA/AmiB activator) [Peribacillus cavernae]RUQ31471.1 hypothetical protein ELQ35_03745 [Peribacillus cavernae]